MKIEDLRNTAWRFNERLRYLSRRGEILEEEYEAVVREIIKRVREEGDKAVIEYTHRFDGVELTPETMEVPYEELERSYEELELDVKQALEVAHERIRRFHERQLEQSYMVEEEGIILGMRVIPLDRVGVYVPGGKASYPSTVLMNTVPAVVAGVREVVMVSPKPNRYTLAAAFLAGVTRVFSIGGAQAVAALAFGTETIPKVDKIVGPGNIYVALAKKLLYGTVGIDMVAGPSEVLVISDGSVDPRWVAADLLSQAEHDELAGAFLVTPEEEFAHEVVKELENLLTDFPRKEIAKKSLERFGTVFLVEDLKQACEVANYIAPEHLEILTKEPFALLPYIRKAGAVFLGPYSTEPLGDYVLGPNHTLPTGGTARFSSPLGVYDFVRRSSVIYVSQEGFQRVADATESIAMAEGLHAHFLAVRVRREDL
ncbi:histidinol dehydrogenase [Thermocrinis albus DSM 14484]|uniref:Histidinol dehydrogenase n=1 Tax=Thermocrinis albus (strain DSM 14484 / JCM 11386 / HI 11/12) TaxID=638303 RepID=D3SMU9_THEAH|nr:histidinol dehydrogenase [Thermocrinis albus]ADC90079.1 histidinol dehydrogenase [Thermocrinis albus DSM 14484]